MLERAVNIFWVLLGAAAASYAWTLGIIGSSGPDSGLFPFVSALMIMGSGFVLLLQPRDAALAPDFPRGAALGRVLGVSGGLAFMAISITFGICSCRLRHDDNPAAHHREIGLGLLGLIGIRLGCRC